MLHDMNDLRGDTIAARDGEIGEVDTAKPVGRRLEEAHARQRAVPDVERACTDA